MADDQSRMQSKLRALFLLQGLGLIAAVLLAWAGNSCYQYPPLTVFTVWASDKKHFVLQGPFSILCPAFVASLVLFLLTKTGLTDTMNFCQSVWQTIRSLGSAETPRRKPRQSRDYRWNLSIKSVTFVIALINMLGIAFCIKATGGVEASIFTPFLLTIPTIIILMDIFKASRILAWGCFCLVLFAVSVEPFSGFQLNETEKLLRHELLTLSTSICTLFPFVYLRSSRSERVCPTCYGRGSIPSNESVTEPPDAVPEPS